MDSPHASSVALNSHKPTEQQALAWAWALWVLMMTVLGAIVLVKSPFRSLHELWQETGRAWVEGHDLYGPTILRSQQGYRYGPLIGASLSVLAWLPVKLGALLVRLVNAAGLLVPLLLWVRNSAPGKISRRELAAFLILLAALALPNLESGQFNLLVAGLLVAALVAIDRDRWNLAAGLLALAAVFKVYPLAFGLLLVVMFPRQLLSRLVVALVVVIAAPFLMQRPEYVIRQYQLWFDLLRAGDETRRFAPLTHVSTYRDLLYLFRLYHVPITIHGYMAIQAVIGVVFAVLCWWTARRGLPRRYQLWNVLVLGTVYLTVCGPASEPKTYGFVVPALAWWVVWSYHRGPALARFLAAQACGLMLIGVLSSITLESVMFFRSAGLHPIAGLLLLASHLAGGSAIRGAGMAAPETTPSERQAA